MVMKSSSTIACMLVLVLVQVTQDISCVSARDLLQFSRSRNGFNPSNVLGVPIAAASSLPAPRSSPTVKIPGVDDLTKGHTNAAEGVTGGLTNATTALTNGLGNTLAAPPANFYDAAGLVNGVTSGRLANAANGVTSALTNATSGVTNALGSLSRSSASTPNAEEDSGTTITETFYISSTGLGTTQLTATTHFPPLSEIQIPNLKSIFTHLLSIGKQSYPADSPPSSFPPTPTPTGFEFKFPGFH